MKASPTTFLLVILGLFAPAISLATPSPKANQEIDALIAALSVSQCKFQRNGKWYDATDARSHLQRKYDYLLKKNLANTAEQFIERAASQSSMSGREYRVRCPGEAEQSSASWFQAQLRRLRGSGAPPR
ncbi:DUF5329 domain-containing protein [Pseudoxanthomonas sp. UTMC 1351]|uniref:DUF5329 domain-containing protein n=1 Tax=Pseudoxanthomonas sp. UTMC 1351 TaxID=2695853 RepID=UPI0034CE0B47